MNAQSLRSPQFNGIISSPNQKTAARPAIVTSPPGPKSQALIARLKTVIGRSNYVGLYGIAFESGQGAYLTDCDGNVYLDCLAAASCNVLGYGNADIVDQYVQAALNLHHACCAYSPTGEAVDLAEQLIQIVPAQGSLKVLLGLSGSDACDGAIQAMRKYTGQQTLIKFKNDYHGSTGLSQPASGFRNLNTGIFPDSSDFFYSGVSHHGTAGRSYSASH